MFAGNALKKAMRTPLPGSSGIRHFPQYLGIPLGHLEQSPGRAARLAPALLPFLQRAHRYAQQGGKPRLRQPGYPLCGKYLPDDAQLT